MKTVLSELVHSLQVHTWEIWHRTWLHDTTTFVNAHMIQCCTFELLNTTCSLKHTILPCVDENCVIIINTQSSSTDHSLWHVQSLCSLNHSFLFSSQQPLIGSITLLWYFTLQLRLYMYVHVCPVVFVCLYFVGAVCWVWVSFLSLQQPKLC